MIFGIYNIVGILCIRVFGENFIIFIGLKETK